jgi:hypothetical protein
LLLNKLPEENTMTRKLSLYFIVLALAICEGPAFAGEAAAPAVAQTQAAPAQIGCASALDLAAALSGPAQLCPAAAPETAPELKARPPFLRTCVCSCGAPCQTDADCDGGRCGPGITCC